VALPGVAIRRGRLAGRLIEAEAGEGQFAFL